MTEPPPPLASPEALAALLTAGGELDWAGEPPDFALPDPPPPAGGGGGGGGGGEAGADLAAAEAAAAGFLDPARSLPAA